MAVQTVDSGSDDRAAAAKAQWGDTAAYREFEERTATQSAQSLQSAGDGLLQMLAAFGAFKEKPVSDPAVQAQVKALQDYITAHLYTCTDAVLAGLGALYVADGAFTEAIDGAGGRGTAAYVRQAIDRFCAK